MGSKITQWTFAFQLLSFSLIPFAYAQSMPQHPQEIDTFFEKNRTTPLSLSAQAEFEIAKALLKEKKYQKAHEKTLKLLETYPEYPPLYLVAGNTYLQENNYEQALQFFRKAKEHATPYKSHHTEARLGEIKALMAQGKAQEALNISNEVNPSKLPPAQAEMIYTHQSDIYLQMGDLTRAFDSLSNAIQYGNSQTSARSDLSKLKYRIAQAHYDGGRQHLRNQSYGKALQFFRKSVKLVPDDQRYIDALHESRQLLLRNLRKELSTFQASLQSIESNLKYQNYPGASRDYAKLSEQGFMEYYLDPDYQFFLPQTLQLRLDDLLLNFLQIRQSPEYYYLDAKYWKGLENTNRILVNYHIERMVPHVLPVLKQIRLYLQSMNYKEAFNSYVKLFENPHLQFFVRYHHMEQLPSSMTKAFEEVTEVLENEGYKITIR